MNPITIQTHNLTRDFNQLRAVDGLAIEVPQGAIFGLLGPNGAGKTTTILLLLGLLEPTAGRAEILGLDCCTQANEIRNRTGVLFEHSGLYERLSLEENLDFFGRIWHLSAQERRSRMKDLLYHFDLWDRRKEVVRTLSRGMRRKLAIARVLFHRPNLIFLDEPTSGLDPVASAALREDLRNLTESEGSTVFLTTHNLAEAEQICTQVGVIHKGKLLAKGDPKDLTNEGIALKVVIIGSRFGDKIPALLGMNDEVVSVKVNENQLIVELSKNIEIAPLINLIVSEGAQVEEIHKNRTSLEDAFLKLMAEENVYRHMDNN